MLALLGVVLVTGADRVAAQSFIQSLFGIGPSAPPAVVRPLPPPGAPAVARTFPGGSFAAREARRPQHSLRAEDDTAAAEAAEQFPGATGKYRTLCVRTCDGYYFPVSGSVGRARFMRDAAQCRSSCGEAARLFYMPAKSDNVSTSIDLAGRAYLRLPTAFSYRKSLVPGCTCRPAPWSEAELARHRQYAAAEAATRTAAGAQVAVQPAAAASQESQALSVASAAEVRAEEAESAPASGTEPAADVAAEQVEFPSKGRRLSGEAPPKSAERRVQRERAGPQRVAQRTAPATKPYGLGALFGGGSAPAKYTWPGDAPRR